MLRTIAALLLLATVVPIAEAQCPGGRCPARTSYAVRHAPAPVAYQLADASGKLWQHADPAYLSAWVAQHNRTLVPTSTKRR